MKKHERFLTIVEGRERNQFMAGQVVEAARKRGWEAAVLKQAGAREVAEGRLEELFSDYVLWRGLDKNSIFESERMIEYINCSGRTTINTRVKGGLRCTSNKFFQHGVMGLDEEVAGHLLPMYEAKSREVVIALVKAGAVKYPFCLKPAFGTRGEGIYLIRSERDLPQGRDVRYADMVVEPYVRSKYDWRVFVLNGRALGAMRKIGNEMNEADFAAKSAGRQRFKEEDAGVLAEIYRLSEKAAVASGLDYTGVDLIRDDENGKFYVLETNFSAGWQNGFFEATGVDVPAEIIGFFEEKYREREG